MFVYSKYEFLVSGVTPEPEYTNTDAHTKYPIGIQRRTDVEAGYLEDDVPATSEYIECTWHGFQLIPVPTVSLRLWSYTSSTISLKIANQISKI